MVVENLTNKNSTFLLCYASQKGNAQSIAEDLHEQCIAKELKCHLSCISEIKSVDALRNYSSVVFVGSTTGDGDPPDTALAFMRGLRKLPSSSDAYAWLHYSILGLGDTNYTNFCNFGKTLDKHLQLIGAQRFYECGWADDGTGLEIVVEPWIEGLFPAIKSFLDSIKEPIESSLKSELSPEENKVQSKNSDIFTKSINNCFESDILSSLEKMEVGTGNDAVGSRIPSFSLAKLFPNLEILDNNEINTHDIKKCKYSLEHNLTLPLLPSPFLVVEFSNEEMEKKYTLKEELEKIPFPMEDSGLISCNISSCRQLTAPNASRKALEVTLKLSSECTRSYEPGDSFGIIVQNTFDEVNLLLHLLNLTDKADSLVKLSVDHNTKKRGACIPKFIPQKCSVKDLFMHYLDIRAVPKKPFMRALIEWTKDLTEKRRLMEFVSKEGTELYNEYIRIGGLTFIDFLIFFPSCQPPLSLLLEQLPRLLPRPYSITSSPLITPDEISFVFNVIEIPKGGSVVFSRKGICTGFLDEITKNIQKEPEQSLSNDLQSLSLQDCSPVAMKVLIYFRTNRSFRMPKDLQTPMILVGPGTGIAPFIGFLKHRDALRMADPTQSLGTSWIFFGCRHRETDYLYNAELEAFSQSQILTKLFVCFSRDKQDEGSPKYVQDNISLMGAEVIDYIQTKNASVYVCGDAKNMSKDVFETFVALLQKYLQMGEVDARKFMAQMQLSNRYLQDVWA